jgi:predicted short-subunit dehydrogenase-like oxidoreductase (DUF2520 family)
MHNPIRITSIGSGNVAWHITKALKNIGCEINQVYSKNKDNALNLALRLNCDHTDSLYQLNTNSDLYLIMISDDAISDTVREMPELNQGQIVAHTSGSVPSTVLSHKYEHYGSFYPLQTFLRNQDVDVSKVPFLVYGNTPEALRFLRMTATKLSSNVSEVNDYERLHYHLSAVFINNFTNHIACIADQILDNNKLDSSILSPLIKTTFEKISKGNTCKNQTGPAKRNDSKLMEKHLHLLKGNDSWKNVYKSISDSIKHQYEDPK